jgi:hypothetical protein
MNLFDAFHDEMEKISSKPKLNWLTRLVQKNRISTAKTPKQLEMAKEVNRLETRNIVQRRRQAAAAAWRDLGYR